MTDYDIIVIGSGPAGMMASIEASNMEDKSDRTTDSPQQYSSLANVFNMSLANKREDRPRMVSISSTDGILDNETPEIK